jgi:L-lactate dehydrogenase complex protein LldG
MTTARDQILSTVREAQPPAVAAPDVRAVVRSFPRSDREGVNQFAEAARAAGTSLVEVARSAVPMVVAERGRGATRVLSSVGDVRSSITPPADPRMLCDLDLFVCEAALAVAENGAVWLAPTHSWERAALFLALEVVVVLDRAAIVPDLHAAYDRIDVGAAPFGTFVGGPSKTADIEQSLVIGAQGPLRLTILLA